MVVHEHTSLSHAAFINVRALVLGSLIGYGFWYVAHHANQFALVVWTLALIVLIGSLWTTHFSMDKKYRLNYVVLPLILFSSALFFFLLLKNPIYQLVFCLAIATLYAFLFRAYAEFREHPTPERKKSMTQTLDIVGVITMFLAFASLEELHFFFAWKLYWFVLAGISLSAVLLYTTYWHHRLMTLRAWFFIALGALLMGEYLWALSFLPAGYLTSALLALVGLFLYQMITVATLRGLLRRRVILQHIAAASVISVIALLTSHWTPLV